MFLAKLVCSPIYKFIGIKQGYFILSINNYTKKE